MPRVKTDDPPPDGTRGRLIWDARVAKRLSLDALAQKLGTTRQVVIGWERESRLPQARHRDGLCRELNLTPEELMVPRRGGMAALWQAVQSLEERIDALENERYAPVSKQPGRGRARK